MEVNGDLAKIPGTAIYNVDKPTDDESGQTERTIRTDGRWWIDTGLN